MPLPLYDYDYNRIAPMMVQIVPTICIETLNCEQVVTDAPMTIGIRQGSNRTNPFVAQYKLDASTTGSFMIGTYRYRVKLAMPNGTSIFSDLIPFNIS